VDAAFERLASSSGAGSAADRLKILGALLARATQARPISSSGSSWASSGRGRWRRHGGRDRRCDRISLAEIRRAIMLSGTPLRGGAALTEGRPGLARFHLRLFQPIQPMLAQPGEDLDRAMERLGEAALEYKIDGARVQVHKSGGDVRVYSRLLNDVTVAFPSWPRRCARFRPGDDPHGEVIALRADGRPLPFQFTMRRFGRKLDVDRLRGSFRSHPSSSISPPRWP